MAIRYYIAKGCSLSTSASYGEGKRNVGRWQMQRGALANATWGVGKCDVGRWQMPRGAFGHSPGKTKIYNIIR